MARHVLAILSAVHGAGRAHGALHPTAVEVEYEGSERVRLKVLPTCLLCFSWENLAPELQRRPRPGAAAATRPHVPPPASPGRTSPTSSGSRALVGSSNNMSLGFMASARAIATRCC